MATKENPREILHKYGLKVTATRIRVLDVLINSPVALSHSDIIGLIDDPMIDKVTVYRTLNAFTTQGLTHKVANEDRNWLYALYFHNSNQPATSDDHAHFICRQCERIYCMPITSMNPKPDVREIGGFVITSHEHRIHGVCPECH